MCPTSTEAPESEVSRNFCGTKSCFSGSPVSICEIRTTAKQHFFRSSSHISTRSTEELKDSTGCVGYYTNRQEKKRPRKMHFDPKAVLVFKRNNPSISNSCSFPDTRCCAKKIPEEQKPEWLYKHGKKKDNQQRYSNLPFLIKMNRKRKHFYI